MDSLFPFRRDRRLDYIQRDIVAYIQSPDYHFELPEISPKLWRQLNSDCTLAEQLEFLGDSLMHSFFSDGLNKHFPYEGPGFYTHVRSVLEANSTFAHLMIKVGFSSTGDPVKPAGDIFESIMAASHREQGSEVFTQYFRRNFSELIIQAGEAWKVYQSMLWLRPERERQHRAPKLHLQRPIGHGKSIERRLATKMLRRKYARKASLPIKRAMSSSEAEKRKIPEVIDLSGDNDCEMELLVSPIREMQQVSTSEAQMSSSKPEYVVPGHHVGLLINYS